MPHTWGIYHLWELAGCTPGFLPEAVTHLQAPQGRPQSCWALACVCDRAGWGAQWACHGPNLALKGFLTQLNHSAIFLHLAPGSKGCHQILLLWTSKLLLFWSEKPRLASTHSYISVKLWNPTAHRRCSTVGTAHAPSGCRGSSDQEGALRTIPCPGETYPWSPEPPVPIKKGVT